MAGVHFQVTGDANGYIAATRQAEAATGNLTRKVEGEGVALDSMFKKIAGSVAAIGVGFSATKLISDIVRVRGEFQQLEIAMETMLGSTEKASSLMGQLTSTAAKTPFGLTDIAQGAKQLLAYGTASEEVNDTLVRLGNIASGLSIPLNDLVYLYGTTMTQGRLFTQDLRQFMGRGIPIADELAKQFGVTKDKVGELVTAGKVGFPEVQKAIESLTNEGGKFYNLMEKQSSSLTGQISNLEDNFDMMLNEIGTKMQDTLASGISLAASLIENYEKIGRTVAAIAATYGTYRAATIAVTVAEKAAMVSRLASIKGMSMLRVATGLLAKQMGVLNVIMSANPYVLLATAVVGLGTAMWALSDKTTAAERAQKSYNKQIEEAAAAEKRRQDMIEDALETVRDSNKADAERISALMELKREYPNIFNQYDIEKLKLADILEIKKQIAEEDRNRKGATMEELYAANQQWLDEHRQTYNSGGKAFRKSYETKQEEQKLLRQDYTDQKVEDYIAGMDKMSTDYLQRVLTIAQRAEAGNARFLLEGTKVMAKGSVDLTSLKRLSVEGENLASVIEAINAEIAKRNETVPSYGDTYKKAEEEWKQAKEKLEAIKKERAKYTEKEYKEAAELEKIKREAFEDLGGDTKGTQKKKNKEVAQSEQKAAQIRLESANKAQREREDIENEAEQASINALADGAEKRRRQRELDNKIELQQIKRSKEDFVDAYVEREKAIFDAEEEVKAAKTKDYKKKTFDEAASRAKAASSEGAKKYDIIYSDTQAKQQTEGLEELRSKYEDFAQAVKRIDSELAEEMSQMKNADGTLVSGFSQENIDLAVKKAEEAKDALAVQYVESEEEFQVFVRSLADKTIKELEVMLAEAENELNSMDISAVDPDELAKARAEVAKLKEQLKTLKVDKGVKESSVNWTDLNKVLSESADKFTELGEIIPGVAGQTLAGIGSIATATISVANGITAIGEAVSAAEKASAILAVVSAVISVIQKLTSAYKENAEANEAAADAARDYEQALTELSYTQRREDFDSIFGTNSLGLFAENIKIATEQLQTLKAELAEGTGWDEKDQKKFVSASSGWGVYSKKYRDTVKEMYQNMDNILVSDLRTGWQRFWGTGNDNLQVISLDSFIDEEGMLDSEKLRAWYEAYGEGLTSEQKNIVEDLLAGWDSYYETLEQMESYVSGLFGDTIGSIADKWIESFDETGSAITDLKEISNDFAKSFAKDMLKNMLATEVFNDANTQAMLDFIKSGDMEGATEFYNNLVEQAEALGSAATGVIQSAGVQSTGESTRSATEAVKAQASQESITELNGRATAIQSHTFSINERVGNLVSITAQILGRVSSIDNKASRLETIEKSLDYMRSDISDILTKGIKVKA